MLPHAERQVLALARKLERIQIQMCNIQGSWRGHLNLPARVREAYSKAYTASRNEYDDTKAALNKAVRVAERYSPGCASSLIKYARDSAWS
jgi:hypothetical protein